MDRGPLDTLRHVGAWFTRRRVRLVVQGDSMAPTLRHGQQVLVRPGPWQVQPGQVVLARHPYRSGESLVKRVERLEGERVVLRGDNAAASTDSRSFGAVPLDHLLGRVVYVLG